MKTIELLTVNPGVDELLDLARKESGLRLTRSGQSIAGIIPMIEQPRKRIAPCTRARGRSGRILTSLCL
jgi:hypothetical protein